jgi:hypothetical protein
VGEEGLPVGDPREAAEGDLLCEGRVGGGVERRDERSRFVLPVTQGITPCQSRLRRQLMAGRTRSYRDVLLYHA